MQVVPAAPDLATVVVVEDDGLVAETIASVLASVGLRTLCFADAQALLDRLPIPEASCILMDVRMPRMSGIELLQRIRALGLAQPVIVMTGYADVDTAVSAFRRGAFDFLKKPVSGADLIEIVQRAIAAETHDRDARRDRARLDARIATLTAREREVLPLLVAGNSNKAVGRLLDISHRTVERHRHAILTKMEVRGVIELARLIASVGPGP